MNIEYSYYGENPILIIKGADFIKAMKEDEELYLLEIAIEGFCAKFNVVAHFNEEVNETIQQWLSKTGDVIYKITEKKRGRTISDAWCEVYVRSGKRFIEIISSYNGRDFDLHRKREN